MRQSAAVGPPLPRRAGGIGPRDSAEADRQREVAQIHLEDDDAHDKGDIATWATDDIKSTDAFQSVDVHAREESTWPPSPLDVTADGAIESRACVGLNTGKTKAQIQCEQDEASGEGVALPSGKDCGDL